MLGSCTSRRSGVRLVLCLPLEMFDHGLFRFKLGFKCVDAKCQLLNLQFLCLDCATEDVATSLVSLGALGVADQQSSELVFGRVCEACATVLQQVEDVFDDVVVHCISEPIWGGGRVKRRRRSCGLMVLVRINVG